MSSMRQPAGNYQYNPPTRPPNSTRASSQEYSIPSHLYVERRSTNPVPTTQTNLSQYVDPNRPTVGYQTARAVQAQAPGMYRQNSAGTPSRNVNPALTNRAPPSQSPYAIMGKENPFVQKETRAEIDDSPIIDPSAFYYLNLGEKPAPRRPNRNENDSGIDSRPIVNLDAVTQLERRRQQQLEKNRRPRGDDGSDAGVDQRSMVDPNAFRHIETKGKKNEDPNASGGVDQRSITNPDAIKNLEARREQQFKKNIDETAVDTRPIINPDAFKYLEQRRDQSARSAAEESGIDTKPIVNPEAFRYLEQRSHLPRREIESGIDSTPRINPNSLQHLERKVTGPMRTELNESTIDTRPIVNPQAFKWIERKEAPRRADDGPDVDERSYVNPEAFRKIDRRPGKLSDVCESEIDTRSFILDRNPNALAHLEREPVYRPNQEEQGGIDQRSYVNPAAFQYLDRLDRPTPLTSQATSNEPSGIIDQRSYVPPSAFRHLEPTGERREQGNDFEMYGQSDL